ncbi:MAG: Hpt domain-containing protein [Bdellovibrionales bacterium]
MSKYIKAEILQSYAEPGDDSLIRDLFSYFKSKVPERFEVARAALKDKDNKAFKFQMHALKNSFLNVGALQVAQECQSLEDASTTIGEEDSRLQLEGLVSKFHEVEIELQQYLNR